MTSASAQSKYYSLALWAMVLILALSNGLLLRQNLQLRSVLKKFEPDQLKPGDQLESFSAPGLNGETVTIDFAHRGPRRVLMFLSPNCPYCREQFSYWKKLIDIAPAKGFQVLAVAMNSQDRANLAAYLNSMGCRNTLTVALIPEEVRQKYKFSITPTTLVISSDGKADAVWTGLLKPPLRGERQVPQFEIFNEYADENNCRGGPPWPPVVRNRLSASTGGHRGPPLQLLLQCSRILRQGPRNAEGVR